MNENTTEEGEIMEEMTESIVEKIEPVAKKRRRRNHGGNN